MRKIIGINFFFISLLSVTYTSCTKNTPSEPQVNYHENKCYNAVQNMARWMSQTIDNCLSKNPQNPIYDKNFARIFADMMSVRNDSDANKNSIDRFIQRLFTTNPDNKEDLLQSLLSISEEINKNNSTDSILVLSNTKGERESYKNLGKVFKSDGIGYALCALVDGKAKLFFTHKDSVNYVFFDEQGQKYNESSFLTLVNDTNFRCIPVPFIHLELKSNAVFAHFGDPFGENDKKLGLPMWISLIAARAMKKMNKLEETKKTKNSANPTVKDHIFYLSKQTNNDQNIEGKILEGKIFIFSSPEPEYSSKLGENLVDLFSIKKNNSDFFQDWYSKLENEKILNNTIKCCCINDNYYLFRNKIVDQNLIFNEGVNFINFLHNLLGKKDEIAKWKLTKNKNYPVVDDFLFKFFQNHKNNYSEFVKKRKKIRDAEEKLKTNTLDPKIQQEKTDAEQHCTQFIRSHFFFNNKEHIDVTYFIFGKSDTNSKADLKFECTDENGNKTFDFNCHPVDENDKFFCFPLDGEK